MELYITTGMSHMNLDLVHAHTRTHLQSALVAVDGLKESGCGDSLDICRAGKGRGQVTPY